MYKDLFISFWKIGAFTIGGGYVMIPLMEREVVDHRGWLSREEFLDCLSLSQAMPGVFGDNYWSQVGRLSGCFMRGAGQYSDAYCIDIIDSHDVAHLS